MNERKQPPRTAEMAPLVTLCPPRFEDASPDAPFFACGARGGQIVRIYPAPVDAAANQSLWVVVSINRHTMTLIDAALGVNRCHAITTAARMLCSRSLSAARPVRPDFRRAAVDDEEALQHECGRPCFGK